MAGMAAFDPISNSSLRGDGSYYGWAKIPRLEELGSAWLGAPDVDRQKDICRQIQVLCFDQLPYIPTGVAFGLTACSKSLTGVLHGVPLLYNVK